MSLRKRAEALGKAIDQPCPPGITCEDLIEAVLMDVRNEAIEECAQIVANDGQASRSVRGMFYDPIQALKQYVAPRAGGSSE